jgi:hypothetical protein
MKGEDLTQSDLANLDADLRGLELHSLDGLGVSNLENSTFKSATGRCDICIASGADQLTIEE